MKKIDLSNPEQVAANLVVYQSSRHGHILETPFTGIELTKIINAAIKHLREYSLMRKTKP